MLKPELTEEEFERIDRALFAVLESPSDFGGLLYDFDVAQKFNGST